MGRHVAADAPEADALVDEAVAGIGAEIAALRVPGLRGAVLGGGYGRGEGGVKGPRALSNDLDFYVVADDPAAAEAALAPVAEKWSARLGVDVDFCARTPRRMKLDEERLMVQELVRGHFDAAGEPGEKLFAGIERRPASAVPWTEAVRLLANRGMGLMFAKASADQEFAARNVAKCVLGAGDAALVVRGAYKWRAVERAEADGGALYAAALAWKFRPAENPPCGWEEAREAWLAAERAVSAAGRETGADRRSLYQAARWVARRRTLGDPRSFGRDCTVRLLRGVARCVESRTAPPPSLLEDWKIFN